MQLLKTKAVLILLTFMLSCTVGHDDMGERKVPVDIYESTIPNRGIVNQNIKIQLKAQAPNGCYNNLAIDVVKIDSRNFLIKATALFQSSGSCPEVMVYKDTVINFLPTLAGDYFFQVNEKPFEIRKDTIRVN